MLPSVLHLEFQFISHALIFHSLNQFCIDFLITNNEILSVSIPSQLAESPIKPIKIPNLVNYIQSKITSHVPILEHFMLQG